MCDEGNEVFFRSNNFVVQNLHIGNTIIKVTITPGIVYVLERGLEQCYISKAEEGWLWHKIFRQLRFNQLHKSSRIGVVHDLTNISLP